MSAAQRYRVWLFRNGGERAGIEDLLGHGNQLAAVRMLYRNMVKKYPSRLVILCDGAIVLLRSDH